MKKIIKIPLIVLGCIFVLFVALIIWAVNSDDAASSKTEQVSEYFEIQGDDLNIFLNLKFVQNNPWQADSQNRLIGMSVQDVLYSGGEAEGYKIGVPKKSIKVMNSTTGSYYYTIDIFLTEDSQEKLLAQFILSDYPDKKDEISLYGINVEGVITGSRLMSDNALEYASSIFPNSFFGEALAFRAEANRQNDLRNQARQEEEYAAKFTPEGWPRNSVYTSVLLLREGIDDFRGATVGEIFYTGTRMEGVTVAEPRSSGRSQVITVTSVVDHSTSTFNIYLRYNSNSQMSLLERIEIREADGNRSEATTFEEKYMVLMILLPALLNEGNIGD